MTNETKRDLAWKPELSPDVRAGIEAASRAKKDLEQVDAAIGTTNEELATAKSNMDAARQALAIAEADAALDRSGADKQTRRALLIARDEHEFLTARLDGLRARRKTAVDALVAGRHDLSIRYRSWEREQAQKFVTDVYIPAMQQFSAVVRMAAGAGAALDSNMLTAIGHDTVVRNPGDWERNPCSPQRTDWRNDPLYLHLFELAGLVRPHLGEEFVERGGREGSDAAA